MKQGQWYNLSINPHDKIDGFRKRIKIGEDTIWLAVQLNNDGECIKIDVDLHVAPNEYDSRRDLIHATFEDINIGLNNGLPLRHYCLEHIHNANNKGAYLPVRGDDYIKHAASIIDYVFTSLATEFNIEIPNLVTTVAQRDAQRRKIYSLFPGMTMR